MANDETEGYVVRDVAKLRTIAQIYDIPIEGRAPKEIASDLADLYIAQFGQQKGEVVLVKRAPEKRQKIWVRFICLKTRQLKLRLRLRSRPAPTLQM